MRITPTSRVSKKLQFLNYSIETLDASEKIINVLTTQVSITRKGCEPCFKTPFHYSSKIFLLQSEDNFLQIYSETFIRG